MAKKLNDFEFKNSGRKSIYDWDKLLDGNIWELTQGTDFTASVSSFRTSIAGAAKKHGGKALTSKTDENKLVIQFIPDEESNKKG